MRSQVLFCTVAAMLIAETYGVDARYRRRPM